MSKVIFHIDLDAFFASVEQLLHPELRGKPVIVKGPGENRTVVAAASYEARTYGIKAGMPAVQARRLCPQGCFVTGRAEVYTEFSERIFNLCTRFTPLVEPASIDEGYLDMTGTQRLYVSGPPRVNWPTVAAEKLKLTIKQVTGLNCSIGVGANKLIAKMASKTAKPNGIACIHPGCEKRFLKPLPVQSLPGIGEKTLRCLKILQVKTIGDMQELPVNVLKGVFGVVGEDFYYLAQGLGSDTIETPVDPKSVSRGRTLNRDITDVGFIKTVLRGLVADVGRQLRLLGFWARLVTVRIRYGDFTTVGHQAPLPNLTNLDHEIYPLACRLFDELYQRSLTIRLVCVGVSQLARRCQRQMEFWEFDRFEKDRHIYHALDHIRTRYGDDAIQFADDGHMTAKTI